MPKYVRKMGKICTVKITTAINQLQLNNFLRHLYRSSLFRLKSNHLSNFTAYKLLLIDRYLLAYKQETIPKRGQVLYFYPACRNTTHLHARIHDKAINIYVVNGAPTIPCREKGYICPEAVYPPPHILLNILYRKFTNLTLMSVPIRIQNKHGFVRRTVRMKKAKSEDLTRYKLPSRGTRCFTRQKLVHNIRNV